MSLKGFPQGNLVTLRYMLSVWFIHRHIFETEIKLTASKMSIQMLQEASEELRKQINQASANKEQLYHKYQQIQDFQLIAVSMHQCINIHPAAKQQEGLLLAAIIIKTLEFGYV